MFVTVCGDIVCSIYQVVPSKRGHIFCSIICLRATGNGTVSHGNLFLSSVSYASLCMISAQRTVDGIESVWAVRPPTAHSDTVI